MNKYNASYAHKRYNKNTFFTVKHKHILVLDSFSRSWFDHPNEESES